MEQEDRLYRPNQIVAYNLRRLRTAKDWSQAEAARRLEQYLGVEWTSANFSVAERYWPKERQKVREFGADEIVAFAAVFGVGIDSLFQPPPDAAAVRPGKGPRVLEVEADYRPMLVSLQEARREVAQLEQRAAATAQLIEALSASIEAARGRTSEPELAEKGGDA